MQESLLIYNKKMLKYEKLYAKFRKKADKISNLRLLTFSTGILVTALMFFLKYYIIMTAAFIAAAFVFIYLVIIHNKILSIRDYTLSLAQINKMSKKRKEGNWKDFEDTGIEFLNEDHNFAGDLDIFGKGSLFQWLNTGNTLIGRKKLANAFLNTNRKLDTVKQRQEAVSDLSHRINFRQRLQAEGDKIKSSNKNIDSLLEWAKDIDYKILDPKVRAFYFALPVLTILSLVFAYGLGLISGLIPIILIAIQICILKIYSKRRNKKLNVTEKYQKDLQVYFRAILLIEKQKFKSEICIDLQRKLCDSAGNKASKQLKNLSKIVDSISNRRNIYFFIFNILTLWEYHMYYTLEKWKKVSGIKIKEWIDILGEYEMLASLSNITFDYPEWTYPIVDDGIQRVKAKSLGHPLITTEMVTNDLTIQNPKTVLLITGSNMSGKSTFLRTAGINMVLAYAGAKVCAKSFECTVMDIYTCMRISDNLEKNTSSFYEELIRIKKIVEAAKEGKKVFFLLDEIFKGTNSIDRHTGAKALIKELSSEGCLGMVSTHDLELYEIAEEKNSKVENYHFEEHYINNEIRFDYKLKEGVSTTRNAKFLMKLAGIDIE